MSLPRKAWTLLLAAANLVAPFFFFGHLEAEIVLAVFFVNIIALASLTALCGYTRLVSLGHALWIPLVYFFWTQLADIPPNTFFGIWIRVVMVLNTLTLLMDAVDVYLYVRGDREVKTK
jgi:ABC-type branched-subunit amino acid transport system permease subunit